MPLTTPDRTDVGRAAIAIAAGAAHHGALWNRSVNTHAYARVEIEAREITVPQTRAAGDSRDDEEEPQPQDPEGSVEDRASEPVPPLSVNGEETGHPFLGTFWPT